jgi:hypothetical protein
MHLTTRGFEMSEVADQTQQEFWRPPVAETVGAPAASILSPATAACADCGAEFMIGSRFCHACGTQRPEPSPFPIRALWQRQMTWLRTAKSDLIQGNFEVPGWLRYLHFHEIKRWVGLPTAAFVAFMVGLGCVAGAIGVGLVYKASNMAEFQAVQLWRIEWLLAATASFVAGILLRKSSGDE